MATSDKSASHAARAATAAWLLASVFYFYQYLLRSASAVMVPELTAALATTAGGLSAILGLFYLGYAPFSVAAGMAMDQLGPRRVMPPAALLVGLGCFLFAAGQWAVSALGSFVQGAAGAFSLVGAAYIATTRFPPSRAGTLIGVTQMFGMAGGSAGVLLVAPAMAAGVGWRTVWILAGLAGLPLAALLFFFTPAQAPRVTQPGEGRWTSAGVAMAAVVTNGQTMLCGLVAGLMFIPTTIFSLVWGVRFLQEGHAMTYMVAALRSSSVTIGWIIGSPLLGALSDRIGRRKPVVIASAAVLLVSLGLILYGPADVFPPYSLGIVAGIASSGAMVLYTIGKEVNRPEHAGTATGVIGFVNFSLSALLGPLFGMLLVRASQGGDRQLSHYQVAFQPLLYGVALAILLAFLLRETGTAAGRTRAVHMPAPEPS